MRHDVPRILERSPGLARRLRHADMDFAVLDSHARYAVAAHGGTLTVAEEKADSLVCKADFVLAADSAAWARFAGSEPAPGFHDIVAMIECGHARVSGDLLPFFRDLLLVKGVVSAIFRGEARW